MKPQRIVEDLGLAQRLKEIEREFERREGEYKNIGVCLNQIEKFYKKWEGRLNYRSINENED